MLTADQKAEWVRLLRSGKYKQGRGTLYSTPDDSYCCLGVLGIAMGADKEQLKHYGSLSACLGITALSYARPEAVCIIRDMIEWELVHLNDGRNMPFPEIADWIEANVETSEDAAPKLAA